MRVVTNEALIARNRKISHILFFVSLAGMGIGFFYTWTSPAESASQISCLVLPILLLMTLTSVRMANMWIREPRPVLVINESLKGIGQKYTLFHHLMPAPHVLIGPEGVFTITTVWQERSYRVKGKRWYGDSGLFAKLLGYMRQDLLGNPFQDAVYQAQQMQRLVNKVAPDADIKVQPLVVFIHPRANVDIEEPFIPVLYADAKKKPSLRNYLRDQRHSEFGTLTLEQMDEIDRLYGLVTRQELLGLDANGHDDEAEEGGEPVERDEVEDEDDADPGVVYIAQAGQLFYFGTTRFSVDESIVQLQEAQGQPVELVHIIHTDDPEAMQAYLQHKFARKRQKEQWYGLSKKDIAWASALEGTVK